MAEIDRNSIFQNGFGKNYFFFLRGAAGGLEGCSLIISIGLICSLVVLSSFSVSVSAFKGSSLPPGGQSLGLILTDSGSSVKRQITILVVYAEAVVIRLLSLATHCYHSSFYDTVALCIGAKNGHSGNS